MRIIFQAHSGESWEINVLPSHTIKNVKDILSAKSGIESEFQNLFKGGTKLCDQ